MIIEISIIKNKFKLDKNNCLEFYAKLKKMNNFSDDYYNVESLHKILLREDSDHKDFIISLCQKYFLLKK